MQALRPAPDDAPAPAATSLAGTVGVLGGMGPLATVDFLRKLVQFTPAERDQDHIPLVVASIPQIPDRSSAWLDGQPSPLPALCEVGRRLLAAGAEVIVMPCNTAHLWFDELQQSLGVAMIDLVAAAIGEAQAAGGSRRIGLLGTGATLASGLYARGAGRSIDWVLPDDAASRTVALAIAAIKGGRLDEGRRLLDASLVSLERRGADAVILGCTELPLVLHERAGGAPIVDSTAALARSTVAWWQARRAG